jgi:hypothetical protein
MLNNNNFLKFCLTLFVEFKACIYLCLTFKAVFLNKHKLVSICQE